jgi:hypothetical protein
MCTIPDPAVVATEDHLALVRLDEVEQLLPSHEIDVDRLRPLRSDREAAELMTLAEPRRPRGAQRRARDHRERRHRRFRSLDSSRRVSATARG